MMTHWTKTLNADLQVNRTNGWVVKSLLTVFFCYSARKWPSVTFIFTQPQIEIIHMCANFGEHIPLCSSHLSDSKKTKINFWHDNCDDLKVKLLKK